MTSKTHCEITVDTSDLDEVIEFIERNRERLEEAPAFATRLAKIMASPQAYIVLPGERGGVQVEPGFPLLQAIAAMRRGGCR